jgi:hypothetical protein
MKENKMGRMSRQKGKRGEREASKKLLRLFPECHARRSQQYCGTDGDADLTTDIVGLHVEVKRQETMKMYPWLLQAENDCAASDCPIVLHRQNGKPWMMALYLDNLPGLLAVMSEYLEKHGRK